jgi:four helix bundle protein
MQSFLAVAVQSFRDLRSWQAARTFKVGIYRLTDAGPLSRDQRLSDQLREAAASAASAISEGFGRFDPADFGRFLKMARASLIECQNHLEDAVDRGHIQEETRALHEGQARVALMEIGGLLDYLQSPAAKKNAERIRQARFARRARRNAEPER